MPPPSLAEPSATAPKVIFSQLAIVGVGLLGGSLGLAAKENGLVREVVGVGRNTATLDEARRMGAIDRFDTDVAAGVSTADLIVLAVPVRNILQMLPVVMHAAKPGAIITDVGSTKGSIVAMGEQAAGDAAARLGAGEAPPRFVGSHPMAGSEKSGVRYSRANLYEGTTCFVTKTAATDLPSFARVCAFWQAIGTRIVIARPDRHDRLVAQVSHLPHMMAVALVRAVDASAEDRNLIKGIIGNGFRDTTRIACGSAQMWEDICSDNGKQIERARVDLESALARLMDAMKEADRSASNAIGDMTPSADTELRDMLIEACEFREFLDVK